MSQQTLIQLNNHHHIPSIGLGVYKTPPDVVRKLVFKALDDGYRLFDSAMFYGNEEGVCDGIADWLDIKPDIRKRSDIFYTTKIFDDAHGYEEAKKAIQGCLRKASRIGYIDMILIHSPQSDDQRRHGTWIALQEAYKSGTVRNIGVSNYGIKHLKQLFAYPDLEVRPAVNQVELHPWLKRDKLVSFCRDNSIVVEAYSPLTRGMWLNDPDLIKIGLRHNKDAGQVLIRWSLDQGFIPLPKTANEKRLISNLDVFDFKLDEDDRRLLLKKNGYKPTNPHWDPTKYPLDSEKTE